MKIGCPICSIHFPEDFDKSLKCGYWKTLGMNKLTKHYKRVVWDWLVSLPTDEIAEKTGVGIQVSLSSQPYEGNEFEKYIEGYKGWPDEERKQFQRAFFAYRKYVFDPQNKGALSRLILRGFMALGDKKETKKT